ncbi:MAG: Hsp20/alpha crystallin family protein [Planctomycetaceae bacterium]|nr:Hsp20/alpha crystallin family protein [Planctomycetaceae bacterium]
MSTPQEPVETTPATGENKTPVVRWVRTPPIDIFETEQGLMLRADLPGVTTEGLELQIQDNRLTLFGRPSVSIPEVESLVHQEFESADFLRSFILSDDVDHEGITAKLQHGVLEVLLPRTSRAQPRKIEVQSG